MIECTYENGVAHYKYAPPSEEELFKKYRTFSDTLNKFLDYCGDLNKSNFALDEATIGKILVRIDQRKEKFKIFHDETIMNEIKEVALLAYWIIKLKPLKITQESLFRKYRYINEAFATFYIHGVLKEEATRNKQSFSLSDEYLNKFRYVIKFWSLGIDGFIAMIEALNESPSLVKKKTREK